ncbi:MAG: hypothetical protein ACRD3G_30700, partial [Vicinamibacterales bacterium]
YIDEALRAAAGRKSDAWRQLGYRNREALYRRVRIILRRSPALAESFPVLQQEFGANNRSRPQPPS